MKLIGIVCVSLFILVVLYCVSYNKIYNECKAKGGTLIHAADDNLICIKSDAVLDKW